MFRLMNTNLNKAVMIWCKQGVNLIMEKEF